MEMYIKFLLGILSKYFDLSGSIEKSFGLGLWILFLWVFILIMKDYGGFLRFLELLFRKGLN